MNMEQLFAFVFIIVVLFLSPGPSVILSINNGINYGKKLAVFGVLGNVLAFQLLILISSIGIEVVVATTLNAMTVLKTAGAVYLCFLGIKTYKTLSPDVLLLDIERNVLKKRTSIFREAFLITCLNPKALLFVAALLPQFTDGAVSTMSQLVLICLVSALIHLIIYFSYAALAEKMRTVCRKPGYLGLINKINGATLVIFGLLMLF